jgi:membrane protease YdiL (CAAX protease family)
MPHTLVLRDRRTLADAAVGVGFAIVFVLVVNFAAARFWITNPHVGLLLAYLSVWVPLGALVLVASLRHGTGSLARDMGLRFHPIDLLWGLAVGLLTRVVASLIEITFYGQLAQGPVTLGTPVYDGWWLFGSLLAPVLIAPFIEELFFRGLLLRALQRATSGGAAVATVFAVVVSGAVFALVHMLGADSMSVMLVVGLSTFVFGVAAASLAAATGRLGGAIVAHVTFNALVVVPAVLSLG